MEELLPFSWSDAAIDERVKQGIEIEFCAEAIKKNSEITVILPLNCLRSRLKKN